MSYSFIVVISRSYSYQAGAPAICAKLLSLILANLQSYEE